MLSCILDPGNPCRGDESLLRVLATGLAKIHHPSSGQRPKGMCQGRRFYPPRNHQPLGVARLRKPPQGSLPTSVSNRDFASRAALSCGAAPRSSGPSSCSPTILVCAAISTDGPATHPTCFPILSARPAPCPLTPRRPTPSQLCQNSPRGSPAPSPLSRYKDPGHAAQVHWSLVWDCSEVSLSYSNGRLKTELQSHKRASQSSADRQTPSAFPRSFVSGRLAAAADYVSE